MRCCVQNCFNDDSKKTNKSQGLTFHKLPKDPNHSAAWLEAITRLGCRMNKCLVVCSEHFLPEDFDDTRHNQRRVKSGAVPTIMAPAIQEEFEMCRVCLALDVKMYDMKNYKLSEMLQNITGILAIDSKGIILQRVCWECAARLKAAAAFRDKALLSDALLKDLVHIKKSDIATLKQNHTSLKSPLTVHSNTSSDIECEHTIFENKEIEIFLPNDKPDIKERETKIRLNEEEKDTEFQEYDGPWIDVPIKIEIESDPIADDSNPIQDPKSDTSSDRTYFDENCTSPRGNSENEISNTKEQNIDNDKVIRENAQSKVPIINSEGNIVLANDKEIKPMLRVTIEEESSSAEDSQSSAEVSVSEHKQEMSSRVEASNEKGTSRNYKINYKLKEKIIYMKKNGLPVSAIAKETGLTISSITCWWQRYNKNGCTNCRKITVRRGQSYGKQNNQHNLPEPGKEMGACSEIVRQRLCEAGLEHILMKKPDDNMNLEKKTSERRAHHDDLKRRIIALKQEGVSTSRIAYLLDTSRNTVSKWWDRWCNEGHMQNHKQPGRKRKTTPEEDQLMIERVMQEQTVHTPSLAMEFGLSPKCLMNRLKEAGFKRKIREAYVPLKAGRSQKVDEDLKQQIISMKQNGVSVTDIANQFRVPRTTIYQWWQRWCKENNVKVTNDNNTSTSTEQQLSYTEETVEKSLQTPAIISSQKSLWQKLPEEGPTMHS